MFAAACKNPVGPKKGGGDEPPPAIPANKAPLNEKINTADELFNRLVTSDDGTDVLESEYWVVSKWDLRLAIDDAKEIAGKADATAEEIQAALEALTAAYNKINDAKQLGTKSNDLRKKLDVEIAKAEALDNALKTSIDGNNIPANEDWVTSAVKTKLNSAITSAKAVAGDDGASAAELETALTELIAAYDEANDAKKKGTTPDKAALRAKIDEADGRMKDVKISDDGSQWRVDEWWVSPDVYNALDEALEAAIFERDNPNATKAGVDAALQALQAALSRFIPSPGKSEADKNELNTLIGEVTEKLNSVSVSVDGSDIYTHVRWVTAGEKNSLQGVLNEALAIGKKPEALQEEVDGIVTRLRNALAAFVPKQGLLLSGAIDYAFAGPTDEAITLPAAQPLSWLQNDELHITVAETFDSYRWYVDGRVRVDENEQVIDDPEITLYAREFSQGTHTLTLRVTKNGVPYTKTLIFTVN
jgi:hypothetical protein